MGASVWFQAGKNRKREKYYQLEDRIFELVRNKEQVDYHKLIDSILKLFYRLKDYYEFVDIEAWYKTANTCKRTP